MSPSKATSRTSSVRSESPPRSAASAFGPRANRRPRRAIVRMRGPWLEPMTRRNTSLSSAAWRGVASPASCVSRIRRRAGSLSRNTCSAANRRASSPPAEEEGRNHRGAGFGVLGREIGLTQRPRGRLRTLPDRIELPVVESFETPVLRIRCRSGHGGPGSECFLEDVPKLGVLGNGCREGHSEPADLIGRGDVGGAYRRFGPLPDRPGPGGDRESCRGDRPGQHHADEGCGALPVGSTLTGRHLSVFADRGGADDSRAGARVASSQAGLGNQGF